MTHGILAMQHAVSHAERFEGTVRVPGDKSIAHRALILGAVARGRQEVEGAPDAADVRATVSCLRGLGVAVQRREDGRTVVESRPAVSGAALDAGNSGTTARLLAGLAAGVGVSCTIDGDESLRRRPMTRVADPLERMGARIRTGDGGTPPLQVDPSPLHGVRYELPVASAQVKSAVLIAALFAAGDTTVVEPVPTRDHTERMLEAMGVVVTRNQAAVTVAGGQRPRGTRVVVPGDFSSAAAFIVGAACVGGTGVVLPRVGVNPTRTGLLDTLRRMGCEVTLSDLQTGAGEATAAISTRGAAGLRGVQVDEPSLVAAMIDEIPLLAVAGACASGATRVRGAAELRHKECDRIDAVVRNMRALGATVEEYDDGFAVAGPAPLRGAEVSSFGDHRVAMAMAVAGLIAEGRTVIDGAEAVETSYPRFFDDLDAMTVRRMTT